ncbi:protein MNN4-like [Cucumis melo var. makuwa]|uniref:Protein MNN4-like n=1 Tax=Cucumis melo var. makuwa TaxID=1194695 RepID=A0A5A7TVM6_CUCMM|nr:protein MNN4-like [Cucumis melo var. makuwa]TYK26482.1 protein MNN4-like [Cucumis melo var. makuwa]
MSAKPSESHDEIKKVSSNGPVLEQAKLNPLSKNSEGIRTSRVLMQGVEAFKDAAEEKKEIKLRTQEDLLNRVEQVALSFEKRKAKKTSSELCEELEK